MVITVIYAFLTWQGCLFILTQNIFYHQKYGDTPIIRWMGMQKMNKM